MNEQITCMIVDDEPAVAGLLAMNLQRLYQDIEITGLLYTWRDALNALRKQSPDILFLDISMPEKNGMDMLRLLPDIECEVIFTTAYTEYALEAFEFQAAGYLLKPMTDVAMTTVIDKTIEKVRGKYLLKKKNQAPPADQKLGIPDRRGIDYVNIHDILYLESVNRYTRIVLTDSELVSSYNLGAFKKLLENNFFYPVHRSYIVNLNCIVRYQSDGFVIMSDKKEIPVSQSLREEFLARFSTVARAKLDDEPADP